MHYLLRIETGELKLIRQNWANYNEVAGML